MRVELSQVSSVYSGRDRACCCGCAGKHTYASAHRAWASKNRGYEVKDEEVNDRVVAQVVRKLNAAEAGEVDTDGEFFSMVVGKRLYIAYMVEA